MLADLFRSSKTLLSNILVSAFCPLATLAFLPIQNVPSSSKVFLLLLLGWLLFLLLRLIYVLFPLMIYLLRHFFLAFVYFRSVFCESPSIFLFFWPLKLIQQDFLFYHLDSNLSGQIHPTLQHHHPLESVKIFQRYEKMLL